jgi:hypothetical protein
MRRLKALDQSDANCVAQPWLAVPELTRSTGIKLNQQG